MSKTERINRINSKKLGRVESYKNVFNTPKGRYVLWDLMKAYHILEPTYSAKGPQDTNQMLINEGERGVILGIMGVLDIDVKQLRKQLQEGMDNEKIIADSVFR